MSDDRSTRVDQPTLAEQEARERAAAIRAEYRAAYLGGVPDKHHPDL